jgi:hypothetical protein
MHDAHSSPRRSVLSGEGYEVLVRFDEWFECLVYRDAERWIGRGSSEEDAFEDALRQMLPSHFARVLLERAVVARVARGAGTEVAANDGATVVLPAPAPISALPEAEAQLPVAVLEHPVAQPTPAIEASASAASQAAVAPVAMAAPPEALVATQVTTPPTAAEAAAPVAVAAPVPVAAPIVDARPAPAAPLPAPPAPAREPEPRLVEHVVDRTARPRASDGLETVEKILAGIEARLGTLARMNADRQRLNMLVLICRARAVEESLPGVREVEHAVARVARRLTDIGKMFWPGSVRALQLSARPGDVKRELHATWASEPSNWVAATTLAERSLDDHLMKSSDAGLDEDGWGDAAALSPRPGDPDAMLEALDAELKALLIPPGEVPSGRAGDLTGPEMDALVNAARRLRWVRGAVKDDLAWGVAMGRLRRSLPSLGERGNRVRDVLDHRHKPAQPWARLLGDREAEPAAVAPTGESPVKLAEELPAAAETKDGLMAWLIRAFDALNTPELVALLVPLKDRLAAFGEEELNHPDRRVRRRLRELVKRVAETTSVPKPVPVKEPEPEADEAAPDDNLASTALDALSLRVRAQTRGSRALFVSNRDDPELGARLEELLGITISWCDGSLRRVQAACERIARGSYDLVLSATGFQVHGVDSALARASSAAGIPYVRVNRGRPVACVQAIAREFGLTSGTFALPAQAKAAP